MTGSDAISAEAHMREAHVKAAHAAGRNQNRVRESLGVTALNAGAEAEA
ncbi:MAG: hypothetical protein KKA63_03860 [Gammaproteobacteria bacterium]|nr:hypothetical protein [Gammaproteobacteria bacterium]